MSKRFGLTGVFLLVLMAVSAQQKWNYPEIDKKSYELYQQKKWHDLIDYAAESRKHGIDFFYLQARTGIAYYNLKRYRQASHYFREVWKNDQSFDWLQEYLYYSLVFGGRSTEAMKLANDFSPAIKQKINYAPAKVTRFALETGYSFNPDANQLTSASHYQKANVGENYGEAYYMKNYHFESVDFSHQVAPGVSLNHNFTYIGVNREEQVYWGSMNTYPIKINQFQYFLSPHFVLGKKLYISPSMNLTWGNTDLFLGSTKANSSRFFYPYNFKYSDFIFSTATWTQWGNFSPGAEVNFANIYDENFTQLSAWLTFYPFSNLNFYVTPRVYFKSDEENEMGYNSYGISGGIQLGPVHLWGQYLNGDMKNFIESAGYVVANFPGRSTYKISTSLYFPVGKKYQFVLRYLNQDVIENYQVYTDAIPSNTLEYKYVKHTLTAGISWNF